MRAWMIGVVLGLGGCAASDSEQTGVAFVGSGGANRTGGANGTGGASGGRSDYCDTHAPWALCANVGETVAPTEITVQTEQGESGMNDEKCDGIWATEARDRSERKTEAANVQGGVQTEHRAGGGGLPGVR